MIIKKDSIKTFFCGLLGVVLAFGFFLPTSTRQFTLNSGMRQFGFLLLDFVAVLILLIEKKYRLKDFYINGLIIITLVFFTFIASFSYDYFIKTYGNFLLYGSAILCYSITFDKIKANRFWDFVFMTTMGIILLFVIGGIFDINELNTILRTYYVDHVPYMLHVMLTNLKPVTFFTSHSMAAFNYTLFIVILFYRNKVYKKSIINYLFIAGFVLALAFLKSNSSYMMIVCLIVFYINQLGRGKGSVKKYLILFLIAISSIFFVILNYNNIINNISSADNGLLSRYSTVGTLSNDISFILGLNLPTGLLDVRFAGESLKYRDSTYIVNTMRGGIFLVILYLLLIVNYYRRNIKDPKMMKILIILTLLFDFGYTFSWEQRFLTGILFFTPYINFLHNNKQTNSID